MPTYEYECQRCGTHFDEVRSIAQIDKRAQCPDCKAAAKRVMTTPALVGLEGYNWSNENKGKGRRISQLDYDVGKPYYAKSRQEAVDEGHRRGFKVTKV